MEHISESVLSLYALEPALVKNREAVESHLASCAGCASELESIRTFDATLREPDTWSLVTTVNESDGLERLRTFAAMVGREDEEAERLLAEFEDVPGGRFVWANLPAKLEYHTGGVVRSLCRRANGMCERQPLYALALADAAIAIAALLPDSSYPRNTIHELRGQAWKEQANALHRLGRFDDALSALMESEAEFLELPHAGMGLVAVQYVRACVLYEQERLDEAETLAGEAAEAALHFGATDRFMRARHLQGEILFERGDVKGAVAVFAIVLDHGKSQHDVVWIARESLTLGNCHIELGDLGEAGRYLYTALRLFSDLDFEAEVARTEWAISRMLFREGQVLQAFQRLRRAVQELTRLEMLTDAAIATVDLAEMLHASGRLREISRALSGTVQTFVDAGKLTGALTALAFLKEAAANGKFSPQLVAHVRRFIARADRQPELLFAPPPADTV